jgi:hypothetical protein
MTPKPDKAGDVVGPERIYMYRDCFHYWLPSNTPMINIKSEPYVRADLYDQLKQEHDQYREKLSKAVEIIDQFVQAARKGTTPVVTISAFKDIQIMRTALSPREPGGEG